MNIALLHRDLPPQSFTGVAVQVHRLANALCRMGHRVTIFTLSPKPSDAHYETRPWNFPGLDFCRRFPGWKRLWAPLGCRFLDFSGFDVVHVHGDGGFLPYRPHFVRTFYGTAALEARHSTAFRGRIAQHFSHMLEKREARRCLRSTAIGSHVRDFLPGIRAVIPCMTAQAPDPTTLDRKTRHPSLVYVGSQGGRKRGGWALRLLRELRAEFPDVELHFVGPESERRGLEGNPEHPGLRFHARLPEPELLELYRRSWVYACFSSYEGFGAPWAEAMSLGCCVVTTPHAGAREWLRDGENALVRPPEGMRIAVATALGDHSFRNSLARNAFATAALFSPERAAEAYLEIYRSAAEAAR